MLPTIASDDLDNIYLTADTHFGHGNIIKYSDRPFLGPEDIAAKEAAGGRWHDGSWKGPNEVKHKISSNGIEIMDDYLIDQINKTVPSDAKLIHVGDFMLGPKKDAGSVSMANYRYKVTTYRNKINCKWVGMLWGNHDHPESLKGLFEWSGLMGRIELPKHSAELGLDKPICIVLAHYAQLVWDESHRGAINLYGHTHSEIEKYADALMPERRAMDIGVDNAKKVLNEYRPFSLREILDIMKYRGGYSLNPATPKFSQLPREEMAG